MDLFNIVLYILTVVLLLISFFKDRKKTRLALLKGWKSLENILPQFLSILVIIGIMLAVLSPATISRLLGQQSGWLGMLLAGPLYAAFPVAGVLLKKGSKFSNILFFLGAWSTTKIPMLLFEASAMGWKFMLTRFLIDIPGIALIAWATEKILTDKDRAAIYQKAAAL